MAKRRSEKSVTGCLDRDGTIVDADAKTRDYQDCSQILN